MPVKVRNLSRDTTQSEVGHLPLILSLQEKGVVVGGLGETIFSRVRGEDHQDTLKCHNNLASALYAQGKFAEAETEFAAVLATRRRLFGADHPDTLTSHYTLGRCFLDQGKKEEARPHVKEALEGRKRVLGTENARTAAAQRLWDRLQDTK